MKRRAAEGGRGGGVGEGVDALAAAMGLVLVQSLGDEHARGQAGADAGRQVDIAATVSHGDELAVFDAETRGVVGMDENGGTALAFR
jgi:hypothetical protein